MSCQPYVPGGGSDVPQLPDDLVNANNPLNHVKTPMSGPPVPEFINDHAESTLAAPLELVDNSLSMAGNAHDVGEGLDDGETLDDYIEEHR